MDIHFDCRPATCTWVLRPVRLKVLSKDYRHYPAARTDHQTANYCQCLHAPWTREMLHDSEQVVIEYRMSGVVQARMTGSLPLVEKFRRRKKSRLCLNNVSTQFSSLVSSSCAFNGSNPCVVTTPPERGVDCALTVTAQAAQRIKRGCKIFIKPKRRFEALS